MNYRHAFHAGNFADVVKHAVLTMLIERLKAKETAFRVIDTHAGAALYDLTAPAAQRTGEWEGGIGRLYGRELEPRLAQLLAPYLDAVGKANDGLRGTVEGGNPQPGVGGELRFYPGSPWIIRHLLRRQDRLTAVEMHPEEFAALSTAFSGDRQVKAIGLDGWLALGSFVPPKERRGLVLIDPPFEEKDEFDRLFSGFDNAYRRWPTGVYCLWYPVKDLHAVDRFRARLAASGLRRLLRIELMVRDRSTPARFNGCGLVIANPPWQFENVVGDLCGRLTPILSDGPGATHEVDRIAGE
jgi:23S rRNA (adenine2030-N6)-methyltransferase